MPNGNGLDHYFWQQYIAPSLNLIGVTLPNVAAGAVNATIRVGLHGKTNVVQNPDHHTRIHVNGNSVDDQLERLLAGARLGIIGFGNVGQALCLRASFTQSDLTDFSDHSTTTHLAAANCSPMY